MKSVRNQYMQAKKHYVIIKMRELESNSKNFITSKLEKGTHEIMWMPFLWVDIH